MAPSTVLLEDAINETARLEFVELLHGGPEHFPAEVFDVLLVEVVLLDKFQDQVLLLVTAMPAIAIGVPVRNRSNRLSGVRGGLLGDSISLVRDKSRALDFLVHAALERVVEAGAFARHIVDVADLGFDANRELVARIARKSETLRVVGAEGPVTMELYPF